MAITAYPKPATAINTDQFRDYFRELVGTGALRDADLKPYGDSSGLKVKFAVGMGIIDGILTKSTAIEERAVDGGSGGGLYRKDALVANLDFSATPIVQYVVLKGTPAASNPVLPSLALTGSIVFRWLMASIDVSPTASTITAADVTDLRTLVRRGLTTWTTATRPANPRPRDLGFNLTLGLWEQWDPTILPSGDWAPLQIRAADISDSTTIGRAVIKAADAAAARTAIGAGTVGSTVMTAADIIAAREAIGLYKGNGPGSPTNDLLRYRDA